MCLLLLSLLIFGPRVAVSLVWLFQPARFNLAFGSFIWPILGIIFLPWTTLMYVFVFPGGISGWDLIWLVLAFLVDLGSYTGTFLGRQKKAEVVS
jgi:hypothetical protein